MIVCCCDGSVNGIFTAIYHAWKLGTIRTSISVSDCEDMELFSEYRSYEADEAIAVMVANSIRTRLSPEIYSLVYSAALSNDSNRGDAIYRFLIDAFRQGTGIVDNLANPNVMKVYELDRTVNREAHKYKGFLRFGQYSGKNGNYLISRFDPINNILDLVSHHFADRLPMENWIIADTRRNICSLHVARNKDYIISDISPDMLNKLVDITRSSLNESTNKFVKEFKNESANEFNELKNESTNEFIEELWETFRASIAIEPRRNEQLQKQLMPLRYRTYMNTYSNFSR